MSLSKGQSFSTAELKTLGLWEVAQQFGEKKKALQKEKPALTVDKIQQVQQQAYDEASSQGQKKGFEQGRDRGYQEGFEQGLVDGEKQAAQENLQKSNNQAEQWCALLSSLSEPFQQLDERVEKELVHLVIMIASQVIRREIKIDSGQIIAIIREAIHALPSTGQKITIQMHPEDTKLVRAILALDALETTWTLVDEPLMSRGGCKVLTDVSEIDVTVENRLAVIVATILGDEREKKRNRDGKKGQGK